ncbi:hypothetical protein B0A52_02880 [Exophiala mesophila]|uniref:Clock-controlled protein 6 n=1 Tax=Exophiala mesophila TaxID=212818 RepID=A0A438NE37_EXOME|nr:hypothetical protein B0A52_02880 [Exophiala mesophila]
MKRTSRLLPLTALLAATANAQSSSTVINDPTDSSILTVYYSTCPTAVTISSTVSSTITYCPGDHCSAGPTVTPAPTTTPGGLVGPIATGPYTDWTTVGPDGKTTVLRTQTTVYDHIGSDGTPGQATYTLTETCPCLAGSDAEPTLPAGFTTTVVECRKCRADGQPTTVTLTTPCETGPYATVTPVFNEGVGAWASAGASAAASAAAGGAGAAAGASAGAAAAAGAQGGEAGASAGAEAAASAAAGAGTGWDSNPSGVSPPTSKYTGSADRTAIALSSVFAVLIGCAAWLL